MNELSLYVETFNSTIYDMWNDTEYYDTNLEDLCYKKALHCYINSGSLGVIDRRKLLYNYLKGMMATGSNLDILDKMKNKLSVNYDYINNIIMNVANTYVNVVERDIDDVMLEKLLSDIDINDLIDKCHKIATMTGEVLVRPYIQNGIYKFHVYTPEYYRVEENEGMLSKVTLVVPTLYDVKVEITSINDIKHPLQYHKHIWTDDLFQVQKQNQITSKPNNYGFIPFVRLRLNNFDSYDYIDRSGGGYELLQTQLRLNSMDLLMSENEVYGTLGFWLFKNIPNLEEITLGAGRGIQIQHEDANQPEPTVSFLSAEKNFDLLNEHQKSYVEQKQKLAGMPTASANSNISGKAIELDRAQLNDMRKINYRVLKHFDIDLVNMLCRVSTIDGLPFNEPKVYSIRYQQTQIIDKAEEFDYNKKLYDAGLISIYDLMRSVGHTGSDKEIEEILLNIKEVNDGRISNGEIPIGERESGEADSANTERLEGDKVDVEGTN